MLFAYFPQNLTKYPLKRKNAVEFFMKLSNFFTETFFEKASQIAILIQSRFGDIGGILAHPEVKVT